MNRVKSPFGLSLDPKEHYNRIITRTHIEFMRMQSAEPTRDIFSCVLIASVARNYFLDNCDENAAGPVLLFSHRIVERWKNFWIPPAAKQDKTNSWLRGPEGMEFDAKERNSLRSRMFDAYFLDSEDEFKKIKAEIKRNYKQFYRPT